ncbi:histidine phosphatase family protein [Diaphorobacter sp.]|uniref:histidine phosphatase family protein n=1 Tax=Diaphorobacter sp. TaxID=1934310 RepID=UPI003D0BD906
MLQRRSLLGAAWGTGLGAGLGAGLWAEVAARAVQPPAADLIRAGGVVVAFRHAHAPGTYDPPGFVLGDCRTQRNLSDAGRAQAQRIGQWFQSQSLVPSQARSSPWCRCIDTARLAFGSAQVWQALGSPVGSVDATNEAHLRELRQALVAASRQGGHFEVWVTHMFVLSPLTGVDAASGEGLVLRADAAGAPQVLARLAPPASAP